MILRPVTPASPSGPPISKLPVGLMCHAVASDETFGQHRGDDLLHIGLQLGFLRALVIAGHVLGDDDGGGGTGLPST
jgi:hypothetical protein